MYHTGIIAQFRYLILRHCLQIDFNILINRFDLKKKAVKLCQLELRFNNDNVQSASDFDSVSGFGTRTIWFI